jgi:malate dehydrogenase (oxaloacetate-decarboxylating)(NADP+)
MEAYHVTGGRAFFASGNPFNDVLMEGNRFIPGQCNNAYIFPGVGLGIVTSQSRLAPNEIFLVAARTLADQVSESDRAEGRVYPPLSRIRDVSLAIATAIAQVVYNRGLAGTPKPMDLLSYLKEQMYRRRSITRANPYLPTEPQQRSRSRSALLPGPASNQYHFGRMYRYWSCMLI